MKRSKRGIALIVMGFLLLLLAFGWVLYNEMEDRQAGTKAEALLMELKQTQAVQKSDAPVMVGEAPFCGTVLIEKLELELPIFDEWSMTHLAEAPCRYAGSIKDGNLVIAAHNYRNHFGTLHRLQEGDAVVLVDNAGTRHEYKVMEKSTLDGTAVADMVSGDWDLTLFTCTKGGKQRVTVRCEKVVKFG